MTKTIKPTQEELSQFVNREILACQSMLVDALISEQATAPSEKLEQFSYENIANVYEYKCPECGSKVSEEEDENGSYKCTNCKYETTDLGSLDNEPQEIFEWWLATDWLLEKLEKQGEPVLHTDYGDWWGRTTTGQAIALDYVIEKIYVDLQS